MAEELSGVIERITFHNLDNGYCVLRVQARGHRDVVTVVGHTQQVVAGEYVTATGSWVTDRTHGLQFKADEIRTTPPHTAEGIKKYLGSGLVKGIGPKYAERIVEVFKENTLDVIDQSPTFLSQVKGIGPKLVEKIRDGWREQKTVRSIMVFLHSYGIGTARAVRIYKTYGENAIEMVKANPYRLSTDIWGVGFATADDLALKLGIPRDSPFRAQAAVRHVLSEAAADGHVGYPEELLRERAGQITSIPPEGIADAIEQLRITDEVVRDSAAAVIGVRPHPPTPLPQEGRRASAFSPPPLGEGPGEGSAPPAAHNIIRGQRIEESKLRRAKELRQEMTPAERALWDRVRGDQLGGFHFRRQQVIHGFIADFYCHEAGLVVELDGPIHQEQQEYDAERDLVFQQLGIIVVRFADDEVLQRMENVLRRIEGECQRRARARPHPLPPPPGGEGESKCPSPPGGGVGEGSADALIFLKPLFLAELGVARAIKALASGPHPLPAVNAGAAIAWAERKMGIEFAASQRAAIREALTRKLLVITGGPGTGKTTIVRAVIEVFIAKSLRVLLCAPTGRAAKRLAESTGREAKTIHRLLEIDPAAGGFRRNRDNPLDADLLVVDETSMVDVVLMNRLLQAVPPWACVVLVGDVDQLPSVGAGAVLTDLIESKAVAVARLTEVHRQAGSSWIVRAAHAVNRGEIPESAPPGGSGDFYFVEADDPEAIVGVIRQMVTERIPVKFGLDPFRDVQVLTPQVKTVLGVANLNKELQAALNGGQGKAEVRRFDTAFRVGDKVMQVQNNYTREVFNGDIGRVSHVDLDEQLLTVQFDGRNVQYDFNELDELQLAFAVSVHKSQGAEYPAVVIPVHTQHYTMLQRNLLYTAITRGRKLVALVGSRKALWRAVTNMETKQRYSLLKWRLRAE
jgi:ATP-dependent exoDNAse (exonuclease V) alpha subunit/very-short-patch-repair endonuclease